MTGFRAVEERILPVLIALGTAFIFQWTIAPGQSRGNTFFGIRIQPGFSESEPGQAIFKEFRWRIWAWALASAAASLFIPFDIAMPVCAIANPLMAWAAFGLAHGPARDGKPRLALSQPCGSARSRGKTRMPDGITCGSECWTCRRCWFLR